MKEFYITLNFDETIVVGKIQLTEEAIGILQYIPEHCITFSYDTVDPDTGKPLESWSVNGAALIPNVLLPKKKYKDLLR